MMNRFWPVLLMIIVLLSNSSNAQSTTYPAGGYRNLEEFKKKQPSIPFVFSIEKRSKSEIKMNGGNDYKVLSDSISKKIIKKKLFAVSNGETLFINCGPKQAQYWYADALTEGKYIAFMGGIGPVAHNNPYLAAGVAFGGIGGAFEGAHKALLRYLYVIEINDGKLRLLNKEYFETLIEGYPDLKSQFQNEPVKENKEIYLKYLSLINAY